MSKKVTERKPLFGNNRSHALNATRKKQSLNLQKIIVDGQQIIVSAREAKKFKKDNKLSA